MPDTAATTHARRRPDRRAQLMVMVLGLGYLTLAVVGIVTVGWDEFGFEEPVRILGFLGVSTLLSLVHGLLGLVLTIAGLRRAAAAIVPVTMVAFTAMAVFGAVARIFGGAGDPLNLNWWNVTLYLLSAVACGGVYAMAIRNWRDEREGSARRSPLARRHEHGSGRTDRPL